jgi:hypothetical protein
METSTYQVRDIDPADRQVLEGLVGQRLRDDQHVVIGVLNPAAAPTRESPNKAEPAEVPSWWNVYEGLSDVEIERLDQAIRQRANLTRFVE